MKYYSRGIVILSIILIAVAPALADTIRLDDGSILVGKMIKDQSDTVIFSNAFGSFRIKKNRITEFHPTDSYRDDIRIHRQLNLKFNENEIKRNFLAGVEKADSLRGKKEAADKKQADQDGERQRRKDKGSGPDDGDRWNGGRISFSGAFLYYLGSGSGNQPYGFSGFLSLDQGLDFGQGPPRPGIPGLRFEGGFLYFKQSSLKLQLYTASVGLMWAIPSIKFSAGCFILALMPGMAIYDSGISGNNASSKAYKFSAQVIAGYQKSWGVFSLFIQARYIYINDTGAAFHSIGGEFGFGFNAW